MEHVTRTAYFSKLQSAMVRGGKYNFLEHTTLNEKFNVQSKVYPPADQFPVLSFIALGRGGLKMSLGADGEADPEIMQHQSTDAALFNHMPFCLRLVDDDLPTDRRDRYAMRQQLTIAGSVYWAYWLKRVDFSKADTDLFFKYLLNGEVQVDPFVPSEENLSPKPIDMSVAGTNLIKGKSVVASTIINLPLDQFDINEIRNASKIIKGVTGKANVSEVAICTGSSKMIAVPGQAGQFMFNEAIGVQVATFIQALYPLDFINKELNDELELGISEPLFKLEGVNP